MLHRAEAREKPQQQRGGQVTNATAEKQESMRWGWDAVNIAKNLFFPSHTAQKISNKFMTFYAHKEKQNLIATWQHVSAIYTLFCTEKAA